MKNKKKLKGFTLIELIIVLAIFGLILTIVMSLIDPVSKVMKKATTRERTAAYADNICEYITNSLTYAKFMRVYEGDFCINNAGILEPMSEDTMAEKEQRAAKILIAEMLNDAVDKDQNSITGQVRVLKFINTADVNGDGIDDYDEEGQIYETVYEFKAGAKYNIKNGVGATVEKVEEPEIISTVSPEEAKINPEHLEEYSYYFKKGYYTLDPIKDPDNYSEGPDSRSFEAIPVDYYSCLNQIRKTNIPTLENMSITLENMSNTLNINVISYQRDEEGGLSNKLTDVTYTKDEDTVEKVMLFRSPAHLNSASMSLINAQKVDNGENVMYMKPERKATGEKITNKFEHVQARDYGKAYFEYKPELGKYTGTVNDNIYVVYIMPNEMNDVQIVLDSNSNAPDVT